MNRSTVFVLAGISFGVGGYLLLRNLAQARRIANVHLTSQDLQYPDLSRDEVVSSHLTDLNEADNAQLQALGLGSDSLDRLVENRPYRTKLELVSRLILGADEYALIRDKVAVANARETFKFA